ncbi:MAG TPA: CHRD domain-containing protein [Gemmatimonadales bacterium]|nr:CHRD domain-containing protein [Gemmatimonadales bacterium]
MRYRFPAVLLVLGLGACAQYADPVTANDIRVGVVVTQQGTPPLDALNFVAHPVGANEVPPRDTPAQGQAIFHLSPDGTTMSYRLLVADISNVVASHIHLAAAGVNGPIVVFLFGNAPPGGGPVNGVLAEGSFTAADFINALAGHPMSDLVAALQSGGAYVNVHTNDGVGASNTGPGDFPGGEIRDQVGGGHTSH